jgi:hypothetical protein
MPEVQAGRRKDGMGAPNPDMASQPRGISFYTHPMHSGPQPNAWLDEFVGLCAAAPKSKKQKLV